MTQEELDEWQAFISTTPKTSFVRATPLRQTPEERFLPVALEQPPFRSAFPSVSL
jgi:hypothetical protein